MALHWRILVGLALGLVYGLLAAAAGWGRFTADWIAPFGTVFINLLKLIAVPLVLTSLVGGVASLSDLRKLSRIGGKTIALYLITTTISVTLGLALVNALRPGHRVPPELRASLEATYQEDVAARTDQVRETRRRGPLQPLVDMVPDNFFASAGDNRNMLQVVIVSLLLGVGLIQVKRSRAAPVLAVVHGLTDAIIRLVDLIMLMAPLGVFALIATTITSVAGDNLAQILDLLGALGVYCLTVVAGLALQVGVTYTLLVRFLSPMSPATFFRGIGPAQLVAFSTSSSGATLPVTMERCQERLGVSEEVTSFVLPLGATVNMDGTALYEAVAAITIAQAFGIELTIGQQLMIVITATLAAIGAAGIPEAGLVTMVIVLQAVGLPTEGIGLILVIDWLLDRFRTTVNVWGDAVGAAVMERYALPPADDPERAG